MRPNRNEVGDMANREPPWRETVVEGKEVGGWVGHGGGGSRSIIRNVKAIELTFLA